jgi:2-deoxy-D-gluconate 3-dehydrogenase
VEKLGRKCTIYTVDLASASSVKDLACKVLAENQIDILVNCAGIQSRHPAAEFPDEDWTRVIQVNLNTPFVLCREVGAQMLSRERDVNGRRGNIINIASLLTFQGGLNVPAYSASKGGIAQMTKAMSNEWASEGISINCIAPGYIYTEMNEAIIKDNARAPAILQRIPAGRWGTPEDFKGPIVFLASHAAAYVNGEVPVVDGGWLGR